jgi:WD40 repeat protein
VTEWERAGSPVCVGGIAIRGFSRWEHLRNRRNRQGFISRRVYSNYPMSLRRKLSKFSLRRTTSGKSAAAPVPSSTIELNSANIPTVTRVPAAVDFSPSANVLPSASLPPSVVMSQPDDVTLSDVPPSTISQTEIFFNSGQLEAAHQSAEPASKSLSSVIPPEPIDRTRSAAQDSVVLPCTPGSLMSTFQVKCHVTAVAFTPCGTRVVVGGYGKSHTVGYIQQLDTATGEVLWDCDGHRGDITSLAMSSDGCRVVSGSTDLTVRVWSTRAGEAVSEPLFGHCRSVSSIALSPDEVYIVSGSWDKSVRVWYMKTGDPVWDPLRGHDGNVNSVAVSSDGSRIASASDDKTLRMWSMATGDAVGEPLHGHTDSVLSVAFSPDGKRVVSGSRDKTIRIWSISQCQVIHNQGIVRSISVTCDGGYIVSGSFEGIIQLRSWENDTVEQIFSHGANLMSVAISRDGSLIASGSRDKAVRIWSL